MVDVGLDTAAGDAAVAAGVRRCARSTPIACFGLAVVLPLVMLVASPAIAWFTRDKARRRRRRRRKLLAQEVEHDWRHSTPEPLRFVGGEADLAYGVVT